TRLRVPDDYPGAQPTDATRNRELPALDLIAERFEFRGKQLGRVEIKAQRAGADWRVDRLELITPEATVSRRGLWRTAPAATWINSDLKASAAAKSLNRLGYGEVLAGGNAAMQGALYWQGDPTSIDYASLSGEVQLQAFKGQFVKIDPGIGKLISLMS